MREGWTYKTFGEVGFFLRGKSIQKADFVEKGFPCIHYGQIHTKFGISVERHLSEIPLDLFNKSIIASYGDVIIAITSEDLEGSCKSTAWLGNYDVAVSSHAAVYKHNLNPKFIAYYLRSNCFYYEKMKYARGFKVMEIKPTDIEKIPIPVPPLSEQERIVSELDLLSSIIEKKKAQLQEYDQLAQSIFYDMFGDPVTNEKGWEVKKLREVATLINGDRGRNYPSRDDFVKNGIPFINAGHLSKGRIDFESMNYINEEKYNNLSSGKIKEGDILFCLRGSLGKKAIVIGIERGAIASSLVIIRGVSASNLYLNSFLGSQLVSSYIKGCNNGSSQPNLSAKSVSDFIIPLPPLSLQQQFAEKIEAIEKQKELIKQSIAETETLFNSRMDYYFN